MRQQLTNLNDASTLEGNLTVPRPMAPSSKFMSGMDALIEGIFFQRRADADLSTAAFISGYRGSPLGAFDSALWREQKRLAAASISFKPGLNEDLAATACWGTQQLKLMDRPKYEGVTAFWYGKGPGVDRAGDVIKHANMAGTLPLGGVVMIVGDDHGAKSSTVAHQSDQALIAAGIPILYPATIQEYLDWMPAAVALSRFAGVWVAFKCVTETVECSASVIIDRPVPRFIYPQAAQPGGGYHIGSGHVPQAQEASLFAYRLPAARLFAQTNHFHSVVFDAPERSLGIVSAGKAYVDVIEALRLLGLDREKMRAFGIRIFKPTMVWPLVPESITAFCQGHREVLVVEEKRGVIEDQLAGFLLRMPDDVRPRLSGKRDPTGAAALLSDHGELDACSVAIAIAIRMIGLGLGGEALRTARDRLLLANTPTRTLISGAARLPAFCSGCPHNRSTKLPAGSMAFGGIGCHGMALFVPELRTPSATHMGGEGANWIGLADYVTTPHIFQNMGEGTYTHSGSLAIRAAVAAGVNVSYKILHNGAAAMTGGQPVEGEFSAADIAQQLLAEGVAKVVVVTEDMGRTRDLPAGVDIFPRTQLDRVQRELRELPGVTALIYEQGCAAERRRLRKRSEYPDPNVRTYINTAVCEGCGDCGLKSSCVSLAPVETEEGRKRAVDQESCNKDYTCVEGFCPSFVTVTGGSLRAREINIALMDALGSALNEEAPVAAIEEGRNILLAGIGGSGIVSLGSVVAKAAISEGKRASTFDVTGLAQKNGPVYSHIRIFNDKGDELYQPRIPPGQLDVLVGCDIASAASPTISALFSRDRSRAFLNHHLVPTAAFQRNPDLSLDVDGYLASLSSVLPAARLDLFAMGRQVRRMLGQGALMNIAVLGYAAQRGTLPIRSSSIEQAISRQGRPDVPSIFAFRLGRLLAKHPDQAEVILGGMKSVPNAPTPLSALPLQQVVQKCRAALAEYQNAAYADSYEAYVSRVGQLDPAGTLTQAVAVNLYKLMRYKDEYEVARLYVAPGFLAGIKGEFSGDVRLQFNLAPPIFNFHHDGKGEPPKMRFGPWMLTVFKILSKLKFLRGTAFDPFGMLADRKLERALILEYRGWVDGLLERLSEIDYEKAVEIAKLPQQIRGFGPIKQRNVEATRKRYAKLVESLYRGAKADSACLQP